MTASGWIASFFPTLHLLCIATAAVHFIARPGWVSGFCLIVTIYLLPPLLFRLYSLFHPSCAGLYYLNQRKRCDWWISHQLQQIYAAVPALEAILRVLPGAYSAWLRLWGSRVGKRVYWTPQVEIVDRHLLSIGDDVVFGHKVSCTAHVIKRKNNGDLLLLVRPIAVGKGVFIGGLARIGPGVKIPDGAIVPFDSEYRLHYAC